MSLHLMDCAVKTRLPDGSPLNPATKLALMAFADSADRHTHIAFPGLDGVMLWAGVQKSRANELVRELVDQGLLLKHKGGHRGRRAEYVVFPAGCCSDCRPPALGTTSQGPTISGAEAAPEGPKTPTVEPTLTSAPESTPTASNGYDGPDSMSGKGSAPAHPNNREGEISAIGYGTAQPIAEKGSGKGALASGPLPIFPSIPPNPQPSAGGASSSPSCARHPGGQANCRACGTTSRQLAAAAKTDGMARLRAAQAAKREAERARLQALRADSTSSPVQQVIDATRARIAAARNTTTATGGAA